MSCLLSLIAAAALCLLTLPAAAAPTCGSIPYIFVNGTTADGTQVNSDFAVLLNCANVAAPLASPAFTGTVTFAGPVTFNSTTALVGTTTLPDGGTLTATGNFFKSGKPWTDVRAWGAKCDNSTDDTTAIQNAISYMQSTFAGGIVYFPIGGCIVSSTLTVAGAEILVGEGLTTTAIGAGTSDITVLHFTGIGGLGYGGLEKIQVVGKVTTTATQATIIVDANVPTVFRDCKIVGGLYAIQDSGVDGLREDCILDATGTGANGAIVVSNGANWWLRDKLDHSGAANTYGFWQQWNGGAGVAENHFILCDLTGTFTDSVRIDDAGHINNITFFSNTVFSSPIIISSAKVTSFVGTELGGNITGAANPTIVTGSYGFAGITATGATCSGNIAITC